jgi:hypothetical protein
MEMFRRAQSHLIHLVQEFTLPFQNQAAKIKPTRSLTVSSWPLSIRRKLAHLELLVAECVHQHVYQYDKLLAYNRAAILYSGSDSLDASGIGLSRAADVATNIRLFYGPLLQLLLDVLNDNEERRVFIRVAALRGLEYLLDHLSCFVANEFVAILQGVFSSFRMIDAVTMTMGQFQSESISQIPASASVAILVVQHVRVLRATLQLSVKFAPVILTQAFVDVLLPRLCEATQLTHHNSVASPPLSATAVAVAAATVVPDETNTSISKSYSVRPSSPGTAFVDTSECTPFSVASIEYQLQLCRFIAVWLTRLQSDILISLNDLQVLWALVQPVSAGFSLPSARDTNTLISYALDWEFMDTQQINLARALVLRSWEVCLAYTFIVCVGGWGGGGGGEISV